SSVWCVCVCPVCVCVQCVVCVCPGCGGWCVCVECVVCVCAQANKWATEPTAGEMDCLGAEGLRIVNPSPFQRHRLCPAPKCISSNQFPIGGEKGFILKRTVIAER